MSDRNLIKVKRYFKFLLTLLQSFMEISILKLIKSL